MALILNLETSTEICSIALANNGKIISIEESSEPFIHSSMITILIKAVFDKSDFEINQIDAVAFSRGPGSFTSLRIGLATAKGICYALDIPLISVDTLFVLAKASLVNDDDAVYVPMIDARRMEVYTAMYDNMDALIIPAAHIIESDFFDSLLEKNKKIFLSGNGSKKIKAIFSNKRIIDTQILCSAKHMCEVSEGKFMDKVFEDLAYFNPFYLKAPNITKPKKK